MIALSVVTFLDITWLGNVGLIGSKRNKKEICVIVYNYHQVYLPMTDNKKGSLDAVTGLDCPSLRGVIVT